MTWSAPLVPADPGVSADPGPLTAGLEIILWVQTHLEALTPLLQAATVLGDEEFAVLVVPLLLWSVSPALGLRVGALLLISAGLNTALKLMTVTPRPAWVSGEVTALVAEGSYGTPSGHAQNAAAVWGRLAVAVRHRGIRAVLVALILVIAVSRWWVGAHFPIDTVVGLLVGGALLLLAVRVVEPRLTPWVTRASASAQALVVVGTSAALVALPLLTRRAPWAGEPPEAWVAGAATASPESTVIDPTALNAAMVPAGALLGVGLGLVLLQRSGGFSAAGPWWQRALRYPVGVTGVALLYLGGEPLVPDGDAPWALAAQYAQFAVVGLWIGWLAPVVFRALRLARGAPEAVPPPSTRGL